VLNRGPLSFVLQKKFKAALNGKNIVCLGIPDEYDYMDAELVKILEARVPKYLPQGASAPEVQ